MDGSRPAIDEPESRSAGVVGSKVPELTDTRVAWIWAAALLVPLLAWMFASPVGASPDEPSHMAYAWGLVSGQDVLSGAPDCDTNSSTCALVVETPIGLIPDPTCHQRQPAVPAGCEGERSITSQTTRTIRYPPPYYLLVGGAMKAGTVLGVGAEQAGLLGRFMGVIISLSILVMAFVVATRSVPKLLPFLIVSLTPISMSVVGSINPSGPEISGGIAAGTALVAFASSSKVDRWTVTTFVYGLSWLAWARPLGFLWAGALLLFGVLYVHVSQQFDLRTWQLTARRLRVALAPAAGLVLMAVLWFGYSLQVRSTDAGPPRTLPEPGLERLLAIPLRWGDMLWETVGVLGWLRTPLPTPITLSILGSITVMAVLSTRDSDGQQAPRQVVIRYLIVIMLGITAIMFRTLFLWQGRYAIPPLAAGLIMWGGTSSESVSVLIRKFGIVAWIATSLSSLWFAARYIYGLQIQHRYVVPNFSDGPHWLTPAGRLGLLVLGLLSIGSVPLALRLVAPYGVLEDPPTVSGVDGS